MRKGQRISLLNNKKGAKAVRKGIGNEKTFEALPFRFLEKPVSYDMLLDSMGEAIRYLEERRSYFFYKKGNRHYQIPARDILYFEALNRKIKIVSLDQTEICYGKIHTLTGQLNPDYFLRVHNSFIINMDHITSFSEKEVLLGNKYSIPVSLEYREQARLEHLKFVERRCCRW